MVYQCTLITPGTLAYLLTFLRGRAVTLGLVMPLAVSKELFGRREGVGGELPFPLKSVD